MTELDEAMLKHATYIVCEMKRPFTYKDFLSFVVDGKKHKMAYGTIRNKLSELNNKGIIIAYTSSNPKFYTIKGERFTSSVTVDHRGIDPVLCDQPLLLSSSKYSHIHNSPVYKLIKGLSFDSRYIHDIKLTFEANGIWTALSSSHKQNHVSKDIIFDTFYKNNIEFTVIIHHKDTVTIHAGCNLIPVELNPQGVIRLSTALARVEEKISYEIKKSMANDENQKDLEIIIPDYSNWTVVMWHFNVDGLPEYSGEKFNAKWDMAQNCILIIYSKEWSKKNEELE